MIWRSNLTHQDYIKHDIQSMTTKFSIRPSGKTKMKEQTNHQQHFNIKTSSKLNIEEMMIDKNIDNDKIMTMIMNDHIDDEDDEDDEDDKDDNEEMENGEELESNANSNNNNDSDNNDNNNSNDVIIKEKKTIKTMNNNDDVANQGVFLNFSSDLSPQTSTRKRKKVTPSKSQKPAYKVNGVNILNRKNLDSKTAIERMQRRRENHNYIERRRRDTINNTIFELSQVVPLATWSGQKPNKGNILKATLDYILTLQEENRLYKERFNEPSSTIPTLIPARPFLSLNNESSSPSSSSVTMNHSSPAIAPPSKNDTLLSPIPVHHPITMTPTTLFPSGDPSLPNSNKKSRFIPIEMKGNEKTYNHTCHY